MLKQLKPILELPQRSSWIIDVSQTSYLGPAAASILLSTYLQARVDQQTGRIVLPYSTARLAAFSNYSGLRHHLIGAMIYLTK